MAELAWGVKRSCTGCGVRFYDLRKPSPVCPKCGVVVEFQSTPRGRRAKNAEKDIVLPLDDIELNLGDGLDVSVVDDDPSLLEEDESIEPGLAAVQTDLDEDIE